MAHVTPERHSLRLLSGRCCPLSGPMLRPLSGRCPANGSNVLMNYSLCGTADSPARGKIDIGLICNVRRIGMRRDWMTRYWECCWDCGRSEMRTGRCRALLTALVILVRSWPPVAGQVSVLLLKSLTNPGLQGHHSRMHSPTHSCMYVEYTRERWCIREAYIAYIMYI